MNECVSLEGDFTTEDDGGSESRSQICVEGGVDAVMNYIKHKQ